MHSSCLVTAMVVSHTSSGMSSQVTSVMGAHICRGSLVQVCRGSEVQDSISPVWQLVSVTVSTSSTHSDSVVTMQVSVSSVAHVVSENVIHTSWSSATHSLSVTSRQPSRVSGTGSGHSSTYTVVHLSSSTVWHLGAGAGAG